ADDRRPGRGPGRRPRRQPGAAADGRAGSQRGRGGGVQQPLAVHLRSPGGRRRDGRGAPDRDRDMSETPEPVAGLEARYAALRQAARSEGGDPGDVLEAAFSELEGAIDLLRSAAPAGRAEPSGTPSDAERGLLRAVFQDAPVPLFLVARDGTVQRVNRAAGDVIGAKPGYATGRPFTAFVAQPSRAAVNSQLTAVGRTGKPRQIRGSLGAARGLVPCELVIGRAGVRGDPDESDPLVIAVRDVPAVPVPDAETPDVKTKAKPQLGAVQAITRRLDLVTAGATPRL